MTKARDLANLLDSNGQIDNADIADNTIASSKLSYNASPYRNIIFNGDISIAQRSTSVAGITSSGYYTCDRWRIAADTVGTWTQSQDTDVPTGQGFAKSLKLDCTTANASLSATSALFLSQRLEGQNLQYLKKGTSSAESLTASFWVKSNKTGTYILELFDVDNTRQISKSYTINSANTWEKKTITFDGDTTGTLDNDNLRSLDVIWHLSAGTTYTSGTLNTSWNTRVQANVAVGQVNLADNTANYINITGVQLETGTASDFEFLPYDVNLDRCYRYYQIIGTADGAAMIICNGTIYTSTQFYGVCNVGKSMRTEPTFSSASGTNYYQILSANVNYTINSLNGLVNVSNQGSSLKCRIQAISTGMTSGNGAWLRFASTAPSGAKIEADAEL